MAAAEYKFYVKVSTRAQLEPFEYNGKVWILYVDKHSYDCSLYNWLRAGFPLYQASPDGRSLGDCPFTQRANLALRLKGVKNVTLILIDLGSKPEWFKKMSNSVPVLERTDGTMTSSDSYEIVQYLDRTYRDPPLNLPGNKEAEEVTGGWELCVCVCLCTL